MKHATSTRWLILVLTVGLAAPLWSQEEPVPEEPAAAERSAGEEVAAPEQGAAEDQEAAPPATPGTELESTVDFSLTGPIALAGVVGEVEIRSIEFLRANAKTGMIKGAFTSGSDDLKSDITVRLSCATAAATKWKLSFAVEFLDGEGNVIDRATDSVSIKGEAKIFELKHTTLAWVVRHIAKARLSVSAKQ